MVKRRRLKRSNKVEPDRSLSEVMSREEKIRLYATCLRKQGRTSDERLKQLLQGIIEALAVDLVDGPTPWESSMSDTERRKAWDESKLAGVHLKEGLG